ncbi:unnamed protein product [Moneuplotes crassus]|uniref:Uncharacterized protein n=1 Tax=Euplotes crassus TaxID=5936 RepID=A0AAD1XQ16_EUPCR|nr:unnamed protein product [Moneuplotes crassus]
MGKPPVDFCRCPLRSRRDRCLCRTRPKIRGRIGVPMNIPSEEEEDEILDFSQATKMLQENFSKYQVHEVIPLDTIINNHIKRNSRKSKIRSIDDYYVFADFFPPGKHQASIGYWDVGVLNSKLCMDLIIPYKLDKPEIELKRVKKENIIRAFKKLNSVFKDWSEDTPELLRALVDMDFSYSKISRIIKSEGEFEQTRDIFNAYIENLKELFIHCIGKSSFPGLSWLDLSSLCQEWSIVDSNCSLADIDRIFIATKVSDRFKSTKDLSRFEFWEVLVRIAIKKYFEPGIINSIPSAVEELITKNLLTHFKPRIDWKKWREMELWNLNIDDLFKRNLENLNLLYSRNLTQMKKFMSYSDLMELTKEAEVDILENKINLAYSYSKMTVLDEVKALGILKKLSKTSGKVYEGYFKVQFTEFIEFIGRLAQIQNLDKHEHNYRGMLKDTIEIILSQFLSVIGKSLAPEPEIKE